MLQMSYRELLILYQAKILHDWDQTATIANLINNIGVQLHNMMTDGKKLPMSKPEQFHPFRERGEMEHGMKVTAKNITALKALGDAICQ